MTLLTSNTIKQAGVGLTEPTYRGIRDEGHLLISVNAIFSWHGLSRSKKSTTSTNNLTRVWIEDKDNEQ